MEDYHDLYLETDVLLLADVFENFRKVARKLYGLDPCYYCTLPSYGWDAMLKMTKIKLELLVDEEMHMMIERGIRGGISTMVKRFAQANNKYMSAYDKKKVSKFIMYLDANNLYGKAMINYLPVNGFKWDSTEKHTSDFIKGLADEGELIYKGQVIRKNYFERLSKEEKEKVLYRGFIYEVDLEYPVELHELHNDYPLAPESMAVSNNMLSPYSTERHTELHDGVNKRMNLDNKMLLPNLYDKTNYVIHYQNLKLYLDLGMKLKKVNRVITFFQEPFIAKYINFNTTQRAQKGISDFEKDFFKLMNNAVFGKTMENVRKRIDFKLSTNAEQSQNFNEQLYFQQNTNQILLGTHLLKHQLHLTSQ
jgi:hypothetical protein